MMFRYSIILIIGFSLTFVLIGDFFSSNSVLLNITLRISFALFFSFILWLLQKKPNKTENEK